MKITDPDVIKNGEKDLIDAVKDDLDLEVIKQILEKKITAAAMSSKGGQIIVHNNEIAFKLDFDLNLSGSLMFDREGNYIPEGEAESGQDNMPPTDIDIEDLDLDDTLQKETNELDDDIIETETKVSEDIEDKLDDDLKISLPEYDLDDDDDLDENNDDEQEKVEPLEPLADEPELEDEIMNNDLVDDDIDDILKESQEFWDQKKDS